MVNLPRGTVTLLFTDVERSTQHWEQHPEAMRGALARHDAILRNAIESHGGAVFKTIGDAFCAVFATGPAALRAILASQRALQAEDWGQLGPLRIRAALHTGAADERDLDYFGPAVNRVARLLLAGHGGQTLLSQTTYDLVRDALPDAVTVRALGEHRLKDLIRSEQIYQLVTPDLPADFPALITLDRRPNNLPVQPTPLIGREREVELTVQCLRRAEVRLLTMTGPGGIGKTRLALQVAAELPEDFLDGVFFVSLGPIGDPALVAPAIAQALEIRESAGHSQVEHLKEALRARQILVVLDNFEHLEAAAGLVAELLVTCPRLKILATSRAPLHLRGEHELSVPALTLPDHDHVLTPEHLLRYESVRLFVERAQAVRSDFALTSRNGAFVAEISRRLDGLPLAIELAAARVKVLPPAAILERLGDRFRLLTGGPRDLPARQQTLRNTIAWSYDLLAEEEQALFRRLSVFVGGCPLAAAEALSGDLDLDVLDSLTSLVDRSLLRQENAEGEARFRMLETIQEYGLGLLAASGDSDVIRKQHAAHFLASVEEAQNLYERSGAISTNWDAKLDSEQPNLRAALTWYRDNDPVLGLRMATNLGWYWEFHREYAEGEGWLATFLERAPGEPGVRGRALLWLATIKRDRGFLAAAQPLLEESLSRCREVDDKWGIAQSLVMLAHQARNAEDYEHATALAEESLTLAREIRVQVSVNRALISLAMIYQSQGDLGRARALAKELTQLGAPDEVYWLLCKIAKIEGEYDRDHLLFQEALTQARDRRDRAAVASLLYFLGLLAHLQGDSVRARRSFEESLGISRADGSYFLTCLVLYGLGKVAWDGGDQREGHARLAEGLGQAQKMGDRQTIAFGLLLAAKQAAENRQSIRASRLFGAADVAIPQYRFEWEPFDLADYQRSLKVTRVALGEEAFTAGWATGQAMTQDQAIAYALRDDGA